MADGACECCIQLSELRYYSNESASKSKCCSKWGCIGLFYQYLNYLLFTFNYIIFRTGSISMQEKLEYCYLLYLSHIMEVNFPQTEDAAVKRPPTHRNNQPQMADKPKKKSRKLKQNPFEDLIIHDEDQVEEKPNCVQNQWIKPKSSPLTIDIVDHSRINKYYSHKSLQKYIKYIFTRSCPNPLWLSIKRQSQIERIIFIDVEVQNNLFHKYLNIPQLEVNGANEANIPLNQNQNEEKILKFFPTFNKPQKKAIFKQSTFLKQSNDLWDALFVYDYEAVKNQIPTVNNDIKLPEKLTQQILKVYQTYLLTEDQRKYNLYPICGLPIYEQYCQISQTKPAELKNKILIVDCEMVMSGNNFQLARASIMNFQGELIYDELFKPDANITNYNTQFSGITEDTLKNVTKKISDLHLDLQKIMSKDTILVGHSLQNDLHAMKMIHENVIDTSVLFARKNGSKMKLKTLTHQILHRIIQNGSHCSSEDCKATLQLMRQKIEAANGIVSQQNKVYHLLNELQEAGKKIVVIDSDLQFIKHKKQYLGVEFEDIQYKKQNKENYISKFTKYLDKNVKNPQLICSRIRKTSVQQEWEDYYKDIDQTIQQIYQKSTNNTVLFINFQVNNSYQIYPQQIATTLQRRRPFCLFIVKSQ